MAQKYTNIIPECYVDTNLIQTILRIKGVNHQSTCSQVAKLMKDKFTDDFAVGIIDSDKKQPSYAKQSEIIAQTAELILCKYPNKHHYFIKINNVMETFILNCANQLSLDLKNEGFPNTTKGLMSITKHKDSLDNKELTNLFKKLRDSKEMTILRETIEYLLQNKYSAKDDDLKKIFNYNL